MEEVRIDKYLWSIRVYKTRTDATDACKGGKVRINGADTKPSKPVKVGDTISAGQVVCIVEAMKLMNEIESEVSGKIVEICVEDGQSVEYGQILMYVE